MKRIGVLCFFAFLVQIMSVSVSMAEERYKGILVVDKSGQYELDDKQYLELVIYEDVVKSINININAADKDLTFSSCRNIADDGSSFRKWFSLECRKMGSFDDTPFSYDYFLIEAYAGISPIITPSYFMYEKIKELSDQLGIDVPSRTFVIYSDSKPIYDFFCYPENIKIRKQ
jgi:hypothetical protein